jgi:hypothetical protein
VNVDAYLTCTFAKDQLDNEDGSGASNPFGLDRGLPVARLAGSTAATPPIAPATTSSVDPLPDVEIYGDPVGLGSPYPAFPATDIWGLEAVDNRSGFHQSPALTGFPAVQEIRKLGPNQTYDQILPVGTCAADVDFAIPTVLSDQYVRTTALDPLECGALSGYYKFRGYVIDRAGNNSAEILRNFARDDQAAPSIAGVLPQPPLTPGATANFTILGSDDVELIGAQLEITQSVDVGGPGTSLLYPNAAGLGVRFDLILSNVLNNGVVSVNPFLFRVDETCTAAGVPYASCPAPNAATLDHQTVAPTSADYPTGAAALPTFVTADVFDVAEQLSGTPVTTPFQVAMFNPTTGIAAAWPGAPSLASWSALINGTNVEAVHKGSTSIQTTFFERAVLFRLNGTVWVNCGNFPQNPGANPAVNNPYSQDQGVNRYWNYFTPVPTTGPCTAFAGPWRVMGIKAGAGLFTQDF